MAKVRRVAGRQASPDSRPRLVVRGARVAQARKLVAVAFVLVPASEWPAVNGRSDRFAISGSSVPRPFDNRSETSSDSEREEATRSGRRRCQKRAKYVVGFSVREIVADTRRIIVAIVTSDFGTISSLID